MKVISIVGHSGSGKTTLVEKLFRELYASGVKVETIKHAHHKVELDTPTTKPRNRIFELIVIKVVGVDMLPCRFPNLFVMD